MLVRIDKHALQIGMFVEAVDCPHWEFEKRQFRLANIEDLQNIRSSSASSVTINTAHGPKNPKRSDFRPSKVTDADSASSVSAALTKAMATVSRELREIHHCKSLDVPILNGVVEQLGRVAYEAPDVFVKLSRLKRDDGVIFQHSISVSALMMRVGQVMDLDESAVIELGLAGLLHDVGKLKIPEEVLNKPGKLSEEERELVRQHPKIGFDTLTSIPGLSETVLNVCLHHHELLDGSGYPLGLKAGDISLAIRVSTVCDVFDALTTKRPYKEAWPISKALEWLYEHRNCFDPRIVGRLHEAIQPRLLPAS